MLTYKDIEDLVARIDYKPNVKFHTRIDYVHNHPNFFVECGATIYVFAVIRTLDSRKTYPPLEEMIDLAGLVMNAVMGTVQTPNGTYNFQPSKIQHIAVVPESVLEERFPFTDWFKAAVIDPLERHECDEWFRFDGELVNDPHKSETS